MAMKADPLTVFCLFNGPEREFFFTSKEAKERRTELIAKDKNPQYHEDHIIYGFEINMNHVPRADLILALLKRDSFMTRSWVEVEKHAFPRQCP